MPQCQGALHVAFYILFKSEAGQYLIFKIICAYELRRCLYLFWIHYDCRTTLVFTVCFRSTRARLTLERRSWGDGGSPLSAGEEREGEILLVFGMRLPSGEPMTGRAVGVGGKGLNLGYIPRLPLWVNCLYRSSWQDAVSHDAHKLPADVFDLDKVVRWPQRWHFIWLFWSYGLKRKRGGLAGMRETGLQCVVRKADKLFFFK